MCISCRYALCRTSKKQILLENDCKTDLVRAEEHAESRVSQIDSFLEAKQSWKWVYNSTGDFGTSPAALRIRINLTITDDTQNDDNWYVLSLTWDIEIDIG